MWSPGTQRPPHARKVLPGPSWCGSVDDRRVRQRLHPVGRVSKEQRKKSSLEDSVRDPASKRESNREGNTSLILCAGSQQSDVDQYFTSGARPDFWAIPKDFRLAAIQRPKG